MGKKTASQNLLKKYEALPELHQQIMQCKAVCYKLHRKSDFAHAIQRSSLRTIEGKRFYPKQLNPILDKLVQVKLLDHEFNCHEKILHTIAMRALDPENKHGTTNEAVLSHLFGHPDTLEFNTESETESYSTNQLRIVHVAVYKNDESIFLVDKKERAYCLRLLLLLNKLFYDETLEMDWFSTRKPAIQKALCMSQLACYYSPDTPLPADNKQWLQYYKNTSLRFHGFMQYFAWQVDLGLGLLDKVKQSLESQTTLTETRLVTQATLFFLGGHHQEALVTYETALKAFRKRLNKRTWFFDDLHGFFYLILMLAVERSPEKALKSIQAVLKHGLHTDVSFLALKALALSAQHQRDQSLAILPDVDALMKGHYRMSLYAPALRLLVSYWINDPSYPDQQAHLMKLYKTAPLEFPLLAYCYAGLLQQSSDDKTIAHSLKKSPFAACHLHELITVKQPWEYPLNRLTTLMGLTDRNVASFVGEKRFVWVLNPKAPSLEVMEQKRNSSGNWTAGRSVALKRLASRDAKLDYLTAQDWEAMRGLEQKYSGYDRDTYTWNLSVTLPRLVEHPLIFHHQKTSVPIELVKGTIELHIEEVNSGYLLELSTRSHSPGVQLQQESQHRYSVIELTEKEVEISRLIPKKGLRIPKAAKESIVGMVQSPSSTFRISADLKDDSVPSIAGDPQCCLQLLPVGQGLKVNLWVKPFGEQGPYLRPGEGRKNIFAMITVEGREQRQKAVRDFAKEKGAYQALFSHCSTLNPSDSEAREWYLENPIDCLERLSDLEKYREIEKIRLEWPQGQKYRVQKTLSHQDLRFSVKSNQQWFEYEGEIALENEKTLPIKLFMDLLDSSQGRFIEMEKGAFIELTQRLKKQLEELRAISEENRVGRLGAGALQNLIEESGSVKTDQAWETHTRQLQSMERYEPEIPNTLQAELRDYQVEGFKYMARLSHWGIGACLADDMGLGKTLQSIAVLLTQGKKGPSLVVAPTSVCFNWCDELNKFATALSVYTLNDSNRDQLIKKLDKMDLLICSYGLLVQVADLLIEKQWQVVLLDEAQFIKNPTTQRWKTATQLNAACRLALTGTPIENHLGELWSIFRFVNPGLLSSQQKFQQKYAVPIEKHQNPTIKRALKNLIKPYILRRLKSEILHELPPKTEQTILVEGTPEEVAFYEAVRLKALANIREKNPLKQGTQRFAILAEISKLRQACCDSRLVQPDVTIENSKIKTFLTLVDKLREGHHRALVFSQFVRYLSLIKAHLEKQGVTYQSIDGQTPAGKRKQSVEAFQSGEGDLFILSLKAGGVGLNLTAADYVVHLDPWWNPAVEDQASDRAHRLGQERPVTIYRLIMKNTIEEKIIHLHANKRTLAEEVLSGGDVSGRLTEDELINLIS